MKYLLLIFSLLATSVYGEALVFDGTTHTGDEDWTNFNNGHTEDSVYTYSSNIDYALGISGFGGSSGDYPGGAVITEGSE